MIQNQNTVLDGTGHIVGGEAQLRNGAKHTVGGNAAELAGLDGHTTGQFGGSHSHGNDGTLKHVLRAGDDLTKLALAAIQLADLQVIGILVLGDGDDLTDHHVLDILGQGLEALYLGARIGHTVAIRFNIYIADVGVIRQPLHRKFH